jgi:chromosome segregation ATPase
MYGQELATHQAELDRERGEIDKQREKMGQIDQQYADRAQASEQQMRSLTDQLEQLKTKPGVDQSTAETLQNQIEKLQKEGIGQDKYQELQKNIETIQSMQQVDDRVIQDLVAQIKSAESAAAELGRTKQELGKDIGKQAEEAIARVDELTAEIQRLKQLAGTVEAATATIGDVIRPQLKAIGSKVADLEQDNFEDTNQFKVIDQRIRGLADTVVGIKQQLDAIQAVPQSVR